MSDTEKSLTKFEDKFFFMVSVLSIPGIDMWHEIGSLRVCSFFFSMITCGFLFHFLLFFNFNFYFILLYNTVLVLPYIDTNPPRVYMSSQSWTPFPPHIISLDHPHAPAPSILYPASNIDWRFVSFSYLFSSLSVLGAKSMISFFAEKSGLTIARNTEGKSILWFFQDKFMKRGEATFED